MKLLFDQNLPPRLTRELADLFPDSLHVTEVGMEAVTDEVLWEYAKDHELTITTKDSDFQHLAARFGTPPKVIWVRCGNCSTLLMANLIRQSQAEIEQFVVDPITALLVIS